MLLYCNSSSPYSSALNWLRCFLAFTATTSNFYLFIKYICITIFLASYIMRIPHLTGVLLRGSNWLPAEPFIVCFCCWFLNEEALREQILHHQLQLYNCWCNYAFTIRKQKYRKCESWLAELGQTAAGNTSVLNSSKYYCLQRRVRIREQHGSCHI